MMLVPWSEEVAEAGELDIAAASLADLLGF
jgi:hypothetical protein